MTAVWMRARAELRASVRSVVSMMVLLGVAGGIVFAAAAAARRTDSSYSRYLAWASPSDAGLATSDNPGLGLGSIDLHDVARLPEVKRSAMGRFYFLSGFHGTAPVAPDQGPAVGLAFASSRAAERMDRSKVLEGRLGDPKSVNEVTVGYGAAKTLGLDVGMHETIRLIRSDRNPIRVFTDPEYAAGSFFATVPITIVGEVFTPGDVPPNSFGDIYFTPAFYQRFGAEAAGLEEIVVQLRRGQADVPAFQRDIERMVRGGSPGVSTTQASTKRIQRSIHLQAIALWLFAALGALALALVLGQAVVRQIFIGSTEHSTLRSLGMTPGQLFRVSMVRPALASTGGAAIAVLVAALLSTLFPTGLAQVVEPNPGFSIDWTILGIGALALVAVVTAVAAVPAWRSARTPAGILGTAGRRREPRSSVLAASIARTGMSPAAVAGIRMALEPGRGRTSTPVRTAILGTALSIAAVTAAFTFASSFNRLLDTPRLVGWNWDVAVGDPYGGDIAEGTIPQLRSEPYVADFAGGNTLASLEVRHGKGSIIVNALSLQQVQGRVTPPVLQGRWPTATDEIALGTKTLDAIGANLGDVVEVPRADGTLAALRVVGRVVLTDLGNGNANPGEGAGLTFEGLKELRPAAPESIFFVRYRPGTDPAAAERSLLQLPVVRKGTGSVIGIEDVKNQALNDLRRVNRLPLGLAGLLLFAAVATLAHTLITSIRRRRQDLALLKTLGFLRRQISATVVWQASTLALVSLLLGLPLGLAAGRWGWRLFADQLGTVPQPVIPLLPVLLAIPAALLVANAVAAVPGALAARIKPAVVLRTE